MKTRVLSVVLSYLIVATASFGVEVIVESARQIPIVKDVDVVVIGGASAAVEAAVAASESGANVFLLAPRPYLGDDICGSMHLGSKRMKTRTRKSPGKFLRRPRKPSSPSRAWAAIRTRLI